MTDPPPHRVASGLEIFLGERAEELSGCGIGLIANQASVDARFESAVRLLSRQPGLTLRALFGPEHGLSRGAQDMVAVEGESDDGTGIRVFSLYGGSVDSLAPAPAMLDGIDVLVADLQDVGSRYYTFAATIAMALEVMASRGGRLVVLDRPNPLGGETIEGPGLSEAMRSFVGWIDVPVRHGLTIGELLLYHARQRGLDESLEVVPMRGWRRSMDFAATGLPWIPPSPNMPTPDTALVYPGSCLVESTNLSEGRGTTRPFEWVGAPYLDPDRFAAHLTEENLPGVRFRPLIFEPMFHKWAGQPCRGVAIHVTDRARFLPVRTGLALLIAARKLAPDRFAWRTEPYEFVSDRPAIDLLMGGDQARRSIEAGAGLAEATSSWPPVESDWVTRRRPLLLYP